VAADCAGQLAAASVVVVSGYATGVDLACHHTALREGGATLFVLAEGLFGFRIKQAVREAWNWERAAVISEFVPEAKWTVSNAMQRNRTICGIPNAMILIEAGETGGSIAAGRTCLAMKRPLFAPVYEGMPEWATGNRLVLSEGAFPLHRSRSTGRANITRVLQTIRGHETAGEGAVAEPSPSPPPVSVVREGTQPAVLPLFPDRPGESEVDPQGAHRRRA
jgi:DNA processing protein